MPAPGRRPALGRTARRGDRESSATNDAAAPRLDGATPFLTLAFLALSVIPSLKITDRGLVDVDRFEIVPLEVA